jgi:hypothetical protein
MPGLTHSALWKWQSFEMLWRIWEKSNVSENWALSHSTDHMDLDICFPMSVQSLRSVFIHPPPRAEDEKRKRGKKGRAFQSFWNKKFQGRVFFGRVRGVQRPFTTFSLRSHACGQRNRVALVRLGIYNLVWFYPVDSHEFAFCSRGKSRKSATFWSIFEVKVALGAGDFSTERSNERYHEESLAVFSIRRPADFTHFRIRTHQ